MFTGLAGYTKLMGSDEGLICFPEIARFMKNISNNSMVIKDIGDAILASFSLETDAVRCAIEIQKSCKIDNIPSKIGIHESEVVFTGSDVFGDGVNIVSRIQSESQQGCINISASVYRDIKNKSDIQTRFIKQLKMANNFASISKASIDHRMRCSSDYWHYPDPETGTRLRKSPGFSATHQDTFWPRSVDWKLNEASELSGEQVGCVIHLK